MSQIDSDILDIQKKFKKLTMKEIGTSNISNYRQIKKLGRGGFGVVYEVEDLKTNKIYADKTFHFKGSNPGLPEMNEIDILCKMEHPNILHAVDFFYDETKKEFHLILPKADSDLYEYIEKYRFYTIILNIENITVYLFHNI